MSPGRDPKPPRSLAPQTIFVLPLMARCRRMKSKTYSSVFSQQDIQHPDAPESWVEILAGTALVIASLMLVWASV